MAVINPPKGPRSTTIRLDDKLKSLSKNCKHYSEPATLNGKPFIHCRCEHYTGWLDEEIEYSCICCFSLETIDGRYNNQKNDTLKSDEIMQLYKTDSAGFIIYFSRNDNCDKIRILRKLFESEFTNEEVIKWLEKHELDLMREAAFTENWVKKQF